MGLPHPASLSEARLLADCDVVRQRRGGPGGQHRNKVETAVVITHRPTGIRAEANERRSQAENQQQAIRRLRLRLATEVRSAPPEDGVVAPSPLCQSRSARGRLAINPTHDDFPTLLAEALDAVTAAEFDVAVAAKWLGVSTTQLVRFLQEEPTAWVAVNDSRRQRGLRPLH
jgi:peptide chain release factor-like protein